MSTQETCDICGQPFDKGYRIITGSFSDVRDICSPVCLIVLGQRERDGKRTEGVRSRTEREMLGPLARRSRPVRPDATDRSLIPVSSYDEHPRRRWHLRLFP